ncbi:MAG TPA: hypothetical protein VGF75_02415 [Candidatus Saccharimonadales bacterium]
MVGIAYVVFIGAYAAVPQFHALIVEAWGYAPHWLVMTIACVGPLVAWYKTTNYPKLAIKSPTLRHT